MKYFIETTDVFNKWLAKLKDRQAVIAIAKRLLKAEEGHLGDIVSVGGPISEMRIFVGKGYRLYFTIKGNQLLVMLCGGDKSSQSRDIQRANKMYKDLEL